MTPNDQSSSPTSTAQMVKFSKSKLDLVCQVACDPVSLTLNFALLQYLAFVYHKRWREPRVILLFMCASGAYLTQVPSSFPDERVMTCLDDISDAFTTLTFVMQISITGREVNRKLRIRGVRLAVIASELLVLAGVALGIISGIELFHPEFTLGVLDSIDTLSGDIMLWYVFVVRFYFVSMTKGGLKNVLRTRKFEVFSYLLFATHGYMIAAVSATVGGDWHPIEVLWYRVTVALCLSISIRDKLVRRSKTSDATAGSAYPVKPSHVSSEAPQSRVRPTPTTQSLPMLRRYKSSRASSTVIIVSR